MIFEMRQLATRITPNLGNHNRKIDRTTVQFSLVLWIFSVHRTEPANTIYEATEEVVASVNNDFDPAEDDENSDNNDPCKL